MTTTNYPEKRSYEKYDNEHFMLYLNEKQVEYIPNMGMRDQEAEPVPGYSYTGDQVDGGTLIKATEANYDAFVSGLIRKRYTADDVEALQSNMIIALNAPKHERAAEFKQSFNEFQAYRTECKENARIVLGL